MCIKYKYKKAFFHFPVKSANFYLPSVWWLLIFVFCIFWNILPWRLVSSEWLSNNIMKGSPCCAGLMRSCLHTYRTKTNLTQHIIQPWGGPSGKYGGAISQVWGGHQPTMGGPSAKYGGVINQLWGGHQPSMGGSSTNYGGAISQLWGGPSANYGGVIFPQQYVQEVKIHRITLATHTSCLL